MDAEREQDAVALAAVARGDQTVFREIYDRNRAGVYRLAYGILLDREEAREVVQEVFLRLYRGAPRWKPQARIPTWLRRVTVNLSLNWRHRMRRLVQLRRVPQPPPVPCPEATAIDRESLDLLRERVARLRPRQRAVLTLYLEDDLDPSEIARVLDVTANAVRVTLHRVLEKLREDFAETEYVSPRRAKEV